MNVLLNLQEVTLVRHSFTNNVFSCTIQRPKISYKNGRNDITLPWTYLFARGSINSMGKFMNTIMFMKYIQLLYVLEQLSLALDIKAVLSDS